jgi:hypothetical protein
LKTLLENSSVMESLLRSRAALVVPKKRTLEDLVNSKETAMVLNLLACHL